MRAVLGIKCGPQHDTGAAIVYESGRELCCVALSEERLSREKQSRRFPHLSIRRCLDAAGLRLDQVEMVCLDKLGPHTRVPLHQAIDSLPEETWSKPEREFFRQLPAVPIVVNHHLSHAATAFCVNDFSDAAVLIVDGSGNDYPLEESPHRLIAMGAPDCPDNFKLRYYERRAETQSIIAGHRGSDGEIRFKRLETSTRSGVGHFYSFFSRHVLGFGHLQEGKAMGLAAWGDPEYAARNFPTFPSTVYQQADTLFLDHLLETKFEYRKRLEEPPTDRHFAAFARWMEDVLIDGIRYLAERSLDLIDSRYLCMAGGVALNVVANRIIRNEFKGRGRIDDMFVQPASSDAGQPLGVALYGYYCLLGGKLPFQKNIVYLGPPPDRPQDENRLIAAGGVKQQNVVASVADLLLDRKIIGWVDGRSEYGPRSLGARSILCWPRPDDMKDYLNLRVKHREAFRPFAPIVKEETAEKIFDADFPVPYMLFNTRIRDEYLARIPAVAHVDGSGRLQTISADRLPRLHALLHEIEQRDGVGVLLNTSFNDSGEPIVESIDDAISCFQRTGLDALVCGDVILEKQNLVNPSGATS